MTWSDTFTNFSLFHLVTVFLFGGAMATSVMLGRRWSGRDAERRLCHVWGVGIVLFQICSIIFWMLPENFDAKESLPLHLCDLVVWVAALCMFTQWRWTKTVIVFLGVGLSSQAFFTPVVKEGFAHPEYWLFWIGHTQIVGTGIYVVAARRYRPDLRDLVVAVIAGFTYVAIATTANLVIENANYGFMGRDIPGSGTLAHQLPPWPWNIAVMVGFAFLLFCFLFWLLHLLPAEDPETR